MFKKCYSFLQEISVIILFEQSCLYSSAWEWIDVLDEIVLFCPINLYYSFLQLRHQSRRGIYNIYVSRAITWVMRTYARSLWHKCVRMLDLSHMCERSLAHESCGPMCASYKIKLQSSHHHVRLRTYYSYQDGRAWCFKYDYSFRDSSNQGSMKRRVLWQIV